MKDYEVVTLVVGVVGVIATFVYFYWPSAVVVVVR
jgi:hypothetical protein